MQRLSLCPLPTGTQVSLFARDDIGGQVDESSKNQGRQRNWAERKPGPALQSGDLADPAKELTLTSPVAFAASAAVGRGWLSCARAFRRRACGRREWRQSTFQSWPRTAARIACEFLRAAARSSRTRRCALRCCPRKVPG